jgi:hypothetical protein
VTARRKASRIASNSLSHEADFGAQLPSVADATWLRSELSTRSSTGDGWSESIGGAMKTWAPGTRGGLGADSHQPETRSCSWDPDPPL